MFLLCSVKLCKIVILWLRLERSKCPVTWKTIQLINSTARVIIIHVHSFVPFEISSSLCRRTLHCDINLDGGNFQQLYFEEIRTSCSYSLSI